MRSAPVAIAWEVWARRRAGFVALAAALPAFAGLARWVAARPGMSEELKSLLMYGPMTLALAAMFGLVNYAQEEGFPRRLFARPVRTWVLVTCPMAYGVAGVVGLYVAWAVADGRDVWGLAALVLGVAMLCFQAIVWVLARHRLTRLAALTGLGVELVTVASLPWVCGRSSGWPVEVVVCWGLVGQGVAAYGCALWHVGRERVGGGGSVLGDLWGKGSAAQRAAAKRGREVKPFGSTGRALEWVEWRRGGLMLPVGVAAGALGVLAVTWVGGHGGWEREVTVLALMGLALVPVMIGGMAGLACGRPDAWSTDGRVPPVLAMRPVTCGQIVAAKLRVAAWGSLLAWAGVLAITGAWLMWGADREIRQHLWGVLGLHWGSGVGRVAVVVGMVMCGIMLTWSQAVSGMWAGLARRSALWVACFIGGVAVFVGAIVVAVLWASDPHGPQRVILAALTPAPWVMAGLVAAKAWGAVRTFGMGRRRGLVSGRFVAGCVGAWALGTACVAAYAYVLSPGIPWARDLIVLAGMLVLPLNRIGAAPLTLAGNRHQ